MTESLLVIVEAAGKIRAIDAILNVGLGYTACVVPTLGHLAGHPGGLYPIGLRPEPGRLAEPGRKPLAHAAGFEDHLRAGLRDFPDAAIMLATDNDAEGDVIALDAARTLLRIAPGTAGRLYRAFPTVLTRPAWQKALAAGLEAGPVSISGGPDSLEHRAVEGRFRAALDRWIGALLTRRTGMRCGRVRAGLLGMVAQWKGQTSTSRLPETGEILLICRQTGRPGRLARARVALHGSPPPGLLSLAERFENRPLPGSVTPLRSVGAAVAPRYGTTPPYHTADLLVHAGRQHGVAVQKCMSAMQASYMAGAISYPRTEGRHLDDSLIPTVISLAHMAGAAGDLEEQLRSTLSRAMQFPGRNHPARDSHSPILPVVHPADIDSTLNRHMDFSDPEGAKASVSVMVAHRTVESCMEARVTRGNWVPAEDGQLSPNLSQGECDLLSDLDWEIEEGPQPPWARMMTTGARPWPLDTILVEGMAIEELGRPSTYASHASRAIEDNIVFQPSPFDLPELTPQADRAFRRIADSFRDPRTSRLIGRLIETPAESMDASLEEALRSRLERVFEELPDALRIRLADLLATELEAPPALSPAPEPAPPRPAAESPPLPLSAPVPEPEQTLPAETAPDPVEPDPEDLPEDSQPPRLDEDAEEAVFFDWSGLRPRQEDLRRPLEPAGDPFLTDRVHDVLEEYETHEFGDGSDSAEPYDAVDAIDDGSVAVGVALDEREEEPQP